MQKTIQFHGAAREVTGSMHLVQIDGHKIALDCGLHQGRRQESNEKNRSFPCPPAELSAVILSHAHIDHCGKLPRLVREGFTGPIYATPPTCDLAEILLADSAHIQEEDAAYWNKKRVKLGDAPIEPLYTQADVDRTLPMFQPRRLRQTFEVVPGARATFYEAGHILGSASVSLHLNHDQQVTLTFSGDLGRAGMAILRDPAPLPDCDYLICESTYGGRETDPPQDVRQRLAEIINQAIERGGKIIIPAFAVGRTQVMIYHFHHLIRDGKIPAIPIIVDSPLAIAATDVYRRHPEVYDQEATLLNHDTHGNMLDFPGVEFTQTVEESKALLHRPAPMIIISASGMCEVGRILHHLKNNVEDPRNTILMVGYQAPNTLGRRIVERQKKIRIFGDMYALRAKVKVFNGFSAHANAEELCQMAAPLAGRVRRAFLVHGEPEQSESLAACMRGHGFPDVTIPEPGQTFALP